eukprot:1405748-Lingulodinium_polyedra.AAC.1
MLRIDRVSDACDSDFRGLVPSTWERQSFSNKLRLCGGDQRSVGLECVAGRYQTGGAQRCGAECYDVFVGFGDMGAQRSVRVIGMCLDPRSEEARDSS